MTALSAGPRRGIPWALGMVGLLLLAIAACAGLRGTSAGAAGSGETSRGSLPAHAPGGRQEVVVASQVAARLFTP